MNRKRLIAFYKWVGPNATWDLIRFLGVATIFTPLAVFLKKHPDKIPIIVGGIVLSIVAGCLGVWVGRSQRNAQIVEGYDRVFDSALRVLKGARISIKVLMMGVSAPAPVNFAHALSKHLQDTPFLTYEVILVAEEINEEFWKKNDARLEFYKQLGVQNRVLLSIVRSSKPIGFDLVIIDEKHVHMTFSPYSPTGDNKREMAIFLNDAPELAIHLSKWFVNLSGKTTYVEARRQWQKKQERVAKAP